MAIQNFLSGGYYGKLGATVGQRWKNKRTIRTYVVPANPRTPTQQANRGKFADAVSYAQMGMQMNYYATVFDDPNFTHWNYRMKVARELKNQGFSNLDLIPIYPTSFVPPKLIQSVEIVQVQAPGHITFAVEGLDDNTDRVLSLMFAIYNESDVFLGYKLYLGYYYASNPGFLEVDVDDTSEINNHCYVRAVTNDDLDSTTDMIASPSLVVGSALPEIQDFNTAIREVQKLASGIKVIFEEMWKGTPTVNEITIMSKFVSNGVFATTTATSAPLENENGYCSILIPFEASDNQHLPAFPIGSNFVIASVDYEGDTWRCIKTNDTVSYCDTDLTRNFNSTVSSISRSGTTFTVALGAALPTYTTLDIIPSIHAVKNGAWVNEGFIIASISDNLITFEQTGATGADIYAFPSGATVTLGGKVVGNGVTYTTDTQTAQSVSNADLSRSILSAPAWDPSSTSDIAFTIPFGGTVEASTKNFNMVCSGRILERGAESQSFSVVGNGSNLVFTCTGSRNRYPMMNTGDLISLTAQSFVCNGVTYNLAAQDVALRNAITTSYYFQELEWAYGRDGGETVGDNLQYLEVSTYIENASHAEIYEEHTPSFSYIEIMPGYRNCVPFNAQRNLVQDGTGLVINFRDEYYESQYCDQVQGSKKVAFSTIPSIVIDGVTYTFRNVWITNHFPVNVSGWTV